MSERRLNIALVCEWLDAWRGGAETSTLQVLHCLLGRGVEVDVFTRSRLSPAPGLRVHTVSGAAMTRTRQSITFAHRVEHLIRGKTFDVIHAVTPCRCADVYQPRGGTVAESVERNLSLISTEPLRRLKRLANRLNLKQRYLLALERRLLTDPDGPVVAAISRYVACQLEAHYGVQPERVRVIYNGVEPDVTDASGRAADREEMRKEYGVGADELLVLLVAHNFRLKGVARWLEALRMLVDGGERLRSLVIGRHKPEPWGRRVKQLGLESVVRFVGPSARVPAFLHAADVLVHPTYYDPCSRVVLEGMVSGLPCITTRWDGASEVIEDGVNGFILEDPSCVAALAQCVRELVSAERRVKMGKAAEQVSARVSVSRQVEELLALYRRMKADSNVR